MAELHGRSFPDWGRNLHTDFLLMAGLILPPAVNIERSKESSSLCCPLAFDVFILSVLDELCILIYLIASVFSFISLMAHG